MTGKTFDVLDRPEVRSVLFYPRRDVATPKPPKGVCELRVPVADGVSVGGLLFTAKPGAPVILYFHGNGEIASDYDTIAPFYVRLGLSLAVFDYRGYGTSGGEPSATALINDAYACWLALPQLLASNGVEAGAVYLMGRSLGSAAAIEIADRAKSGFAGLIIESGFAYTLALIERIGFVQLPDAFEGRDGFGNLEKIARIGARTLLIHGERDWLIPISDAEALYEASAAKDKTLLRIPGAGHNDLMMVGMQAYFQAIARFCGVAAEQQPAANSNEA